MPKIDKSIIQRILEAARIEDVVGSFIELKKSNTRYIGLCPFHDDRHVGSFVVYPKGNCYKCFACDSKGGVVQFLMDYAKMDYPTAIRWLGKKYNIPTDSVDFNVQLPPPRPLPPPLPMLELPDNMVSMYQHTDNDNLFQWIRTGINWDHAQRARIEPVLAAYRVGHGHFGHTIFWQIDEQQRVRTAKMMKYRTDGHRDKESQWNFDWVHAALYRREGTGYSDEKTDVKPCLFGLHLLTAYERPGIQQDVCMVESEKTALLMAIAYGNHEKQVWMACGGLENITAQKLAPLIASQRNIILYPDRDGIEKWRNKVHALNYDRARVDSAPVTEWWMEEDGPKADIGDVVVRQLNSHPPVGWGKDNPAFAELWEKFGLRTIQYIKDNEGQT